eukprot:8997717-Pyramimonas_sp.AAC.1
MVAPQTVDTLPWHKLLETYRTGVFHPSIDFHACRPGVHSPLPLQNCFRAQEGNWRISCGCLCLQHCGGHCWSSCRCGGCGRHGWR